MSKEEEIHHVYTDEIVCPNCGYEFVDSWEQDDEGILDCGECEKEFTFSRIITVDYSTAKIENPTP